MSKNASPTLIGGFVVGAVAILAAGVALFGGETTVEVSLEDPWVAGDRIGYTAEYYHRERDNVIQDFFEKDDI